MVSDLATMEVYVSHRGSDAWGGQYLNLWFDDDTWFVRCRHPSQDIIHLHWSSNERLECSVGEDMTQP